MRGPLITVLGASIVTLSMTALLLWPDAASEATAQTAGAEDAAVDLGEGGQLYMQHCAQCHGADLNGGNGGSLIDGIWNYGAGDWDRFRNTKYGISAVGMPEYGPVLSDGQIREVLRFIRDTGNRLDIREPALPDRLATRDYDVAVEQWVPESAGLRTPWAITFLDDRRALVTEKPGRLRLIVDGELESRPIEGIPQALDSGQGGLLDVAIDPDFAAEGDLGGWVYLAYSHGLNPSDVRGTPAMTRIVRGRIDGGRWSDEQVLFEARREHYMTTRLHFGSRIIFDDDGHLFFAIGERGRQEMAQDLTRPNGKIHRIRRDGSIPSDNPFVDVPDAYPSIWTYGNRNPQGLAVHPTTREIWSTEHGPMGGDELNLITRGTNYGWPEVSYGINYNGTIITERTHGEGFAQPVLYWTPSIAPCGMAFNDKSMFPRWQDDLFVTGLGHEEVRRLAIEGHAVIHQEMILKSHGRVRDVEFGPDGALYVVLNAPDRVLRLSNAGRALRQ